MGVIEEDQLLISQHHQQQQQEQVQQHLVSYLVEEPNAPLLGLEDDQIGPVETSQSQQQQEASSSSSDHMFSDRDEGIWVKREENKYSNELERALSQIATRADQQVVVNVLSRRAYELYPRGETHTVVNVSGSVGSHGQHGEWGKRGERGHAGKHGINAYYMGENGGNGGNATHSRDSSDGSDGGKGGSGSDAQDMFVTLDGSPTALQMTARSSCLMTKSVSLKRDEVVLLKSRGGDGGKGGNGGKGGDGADGPPGGDGGRGGDGNNAKPAGHGGNGGNGGNGGAAGDGANGGRGGDGGHGGNITVQSSDPLLLMLCECDTRGGNGGFGGLLGPAGRTAKGGSGGRPGRGGIRLISESDGGVRREEANNGINGIDGTNGARGRNGTPGQPGTAGSCGSITYQVIDSTGNLIESGMQRYNATVISFRIREVLPDSIFEPGERIVIDEITVLNGGDMTLPLGAVIDIKQLSGGLTSYPIVVEENNQPIVLPALSPGQTYTTAQPIDARIAAPSIESHMNNNPLLVKSRIRLKTSLMDRPFAFSQLDATIPVQYPIHITHIEYPRQLGMGDDANIIIHLKNVSSIPYGTLAGDGNGLHDVEYRFALTDDLHFIDSENKWSSGAVPIINPGETIAITCRIAMGYDTSFFRPHPIQCELYLRSKLIQVNHAEIKCVPHFNEKTVEESDLLLITNIHFTNKEFNAYNSIFKLLGLRANYWDLDLYDGISVDGTTGQPRLPNWKEQHFRNKPILFPLYHQADEAHTLQLLHVQDLVERAGNESSLILLHNGPSQRDNDNSTSVMDKTFIQNYMAKELIHERNLTSEEFSSVYRFRSPTEDDMMDKCKELEQRFNDEDPSKCYVVRCEGYAPRQLKTPWWKLGWTYSYGTAALFRLPFSTTDRLYAVDMHGASVLDAPYNLLPIGMRESNNFFKLLFAIMCSLNLDTKIRLLNHPGFSEEAEKVIFCQESTPEKLAIRELIRGALYENIVRDIKTNDHPVFAFDKLDKITERVRRDGMMRQNEEITLALLLAMHRLELHTYTRSFVPEVITDWIRSQKHMHKDLVETRTKFELWLKTVNADLSFDAEQLIRYANDRAKVLHSLPQPKARLLFKYWLD